MHSQDRAGKNMNQTKLRLRAFGALVIIITVLYTIIVQKNYCHARAHNYAFPFGRKRKEKNRKNVSSKIDRKLTNKSQDNQDEKELSSSSCHLHVSCLFFLSVLWVNKRAINKKAPGFLFRYDKSPKNIARWPNSIAIKQKLSTKKKRN